MQIHFCRRVASGRRESTCTCSCHSAPNLNISAGSRPAASIAARGTQAASAVAQCQVQPVAVVGDLEQRACVAGIRCGSASGPEPQSSSANGNDTEHLRCCSEANTASSGGSCCQLDAHGGSKERGLAPEVAANMATGRAEDQSKLFAAVAAATI